MMRMKQMKRKMSMRVGPSEVLMPPRPPLLGQLEIQQMLARAPKFVVLMDRDSWMHPKDVS